ncbi:MAG: hypothetical protein IKX65_01790 [Prevotella sp.]|nr:hypothetical protein [Prevotella sp.]
MKRVLVSMVFACSAWGMLGAKVGDDYVPQRSDYNIRTEVTTRDDDGSIIYDRVITYLTDDRNHTDTLQSEALPLDTADWSRQAFGEIMEQDFNFDGIPDLQIGTGPMNSSGNFTYDVFIWDDYVHRFLHLEDQPPLFDPYVDESQEQIVSTFELDGELEIVRYQWKDGKLVEVSKEIIDDSELTED